MAVVGLLAGPVVDHGLYPLVGLDLEDIHQRGALGGLAGFGDLIALLAVDLAGIGKEHDEIMGGGGKHVADVVLVAGGDALLAHAALGLGRVFADRRALDIAVVGQGIDALLLLDEILNVDLVLHILNFRLAFVAVLVGDGGQLLLQDGLHQRLVAEDPQEVGDALLQLLVLVLQLLPVETLQGLQAHIQNGLGLHIVQTKAGHQVFLGVVVAGADDADDLVNVVLSDQQTLQQMGALLGLLQVEAGAADDDLFLELEILVDDVPQGEDLGLALVFHKGQHIDGEGGLQLGLGKEAVQHHLRIGVPLQLNDHAHAVAVGLIPDIGDTLDALVLHLISDGLDQHALVHLIGQLREDDAGAAIAELLKLMAGANHQTAAAGGVGGTDAAAAHDDALRGEVGALDVLHQVGEGGLRVIQHADARADHLTQVVRRDVGGHTHGDAAGAVHQQVGEAAGENAGLFAALVKVGIPVHRVLLDIPQHLVGDLAQTGLGVSVSGRGVAIHGAEVAVAVHQHIAHGEILGQTHQRVIDGGVTMGVIPAQHVAHAGGGLLEGLVAGQVILIHGVEDTPVHRLQAVAHVRQGAAHDNGHGVLDIGVLHLRHQRGFHDALIGKTDLLGIVLGFFGHSIVPLLSNPDSRRIWRGAR